MRRKTCLLAFFSTTNTRSLYLYLLYLGDLILSVIYLFRVFGRMIKLPVFTYECPNGKSKISHVLDNAHNYASYHAREEQYRGNNYIVLESGTDDNGVVDRVLITNTKGENMKHREFDKVVYSRNLSTNILEDKTIKRIKHPGMSFRMDDITDVYIQSIREHRNDSFVLKNEIIDANGTRTSLGLRKPQIGSLHALQSHRTITKSPATIVLPTGTGKTEVMICLLANQETKGILVIVPSKSLKNQISKKFQLLGKLQEIGILPANIQYPVVGTIDGNITLAQLNLLVDKCHVIVTVINSLSLLEEASKELISTRFSHLFVDEAHHIKANSWDAIKGKFIRNEKTVVQFTATPFRNDTQYIDGRVVYNFPLKLAQQEGYFRKINFHPIEEFDPYQVDEKIAQKAIEILSEDISNGLNHIIMARAQNQDKAREIYAIYLRLGAQFSPVLLISGMNNGDKINSISAIESRQSRIIVCVDMLGEGYDLPNLKIAALHDNHKSLGITLQFIGRFTRSGTDDIGEGSVVSNIVSLNVEGAIKNLYAENSDRNTIISIISNSEIAKKIDLQDMAEGFTGISQERNIPIQNLYPKFRMFAYKCTGTWNPTSIEPLRETFSDSIVDYNLEKKIVMVIGKEILLVDWGAIKDLVNIQRDLHIAYYSETLNLLFVSSSSEILADVIANYVMTSHDKICMNDVFKALGGIDRLLLNTLGLKETRYGPVRFRMYAGYNIEEGITTTQMEGRTPSNLFGVGYEEGQKTSIGVSTKGKIRCKKVGKITERVEWCNTVGIKLNRQLPAQGEHRFIFDALKYVRITSYSDIRGLIPIAVQRPEYLLDKNEERVNMLDAQGNIQSILINSELEVIEKNEEEMRIDFAIRSENITQTVYRMQYSDIEDRKVSLNFTKLSGDIESVQIGTGVTYNLCQFFLRHAPTVFFSNGYHLENEYLLKVSELNYSFNSYQITTLAWENVDISSESQGHQKQVGTIQKYMIDYLDGGFEVLFDDDGTGEIADIIGIKFDENDKCVEFHLYHCKFSSSPNPGARLDDLYEVCGQTQKNILWAGKHEKIFSHMRERETRANQSQYHYSRFESGDFHTLGMLEHKSKYHKCKFISYIVQPGLLKANLNQAQAQLLGATESYLMDTFKSPLYIYSS